MTLGHLILPVGVQLLPPENISDITLDLSWTLTDAADFREYKVYRHTSSGLDESTGTLIHISTHIGDTTFQVKNLNPLSEYYFRVYVMNEFGRLGGSNIVTAITKNKQVIQNGGFENLDPTSHFPEHWQAFSTAEGYYFVDADIAQEGEHSLRIENAPGVNIYYQLVNPKSLVPGSRYKLSYWVKHEKMVNHGDEFAVFLNTIEFSWQIQINTVHGPRSASDWNRYDYEFTIPDVSTSNFSIGFYFHLYSENKKAWLDNVSLIKIS
jgi:hypothetical protein